MTLKEADESRRVVEWDPDSFKQANEAKKKYLEARKQGRSITDLSGTPIEKFNPSSGGFVIAESHIPDDCFAVRLLNETGDERLIWNIADPKQTEEACAKFNSYLERGWKAYAIKADGSRGIRIYSFDPKKEEVVLDDKQTAVEKLKNFAKSFRKIEVLPRTYPG